MYYKTITITFILEFLAETFLAIYAYPFSSDRYGMMELTKKGDKAHWVIIDLFWDTSVIWFLFYFTLYMRFSIIHKNMEKRQNLYLSVFYQERDEQSDDRIYIRETLEHQGYTKSLQSQADSDSYSIVSNESREREFLISDRKEFISQIHSEYSLKRKSKNEIKIETEHKLQTNLNKPKQRKIKF